MKISSLAWQQWGLLIVLTYLVLIGGTMAGTFNFYLVSISHGLAVVAMAAWAIYSFSRRRWLPRTPLDFPLAAFLVVNLGSALVSVDRRLSLENWFNLAIFVFVYYLAVQLILGWKSPLPLVKVLLMNGAVVALAAAVELTLVYMWLGAPSPWEYLVWLSRHRSGTVLNNANPLAWFLGIQIALVLSQLRRVSSSWTRANLLAMVAVAAGIMVTTFSRSGLIAMVIALSILLFPSLVPQWAERWRGFSSVARARALTAMGLGGLALTGAFVGLLALRANTVGIRWSLWLAAALMVRERPLLRGGLGTYGYLLHQLSFPYVEARMLFFNNAHNIYLNLAAESGLLGLAAGVWAAVATVAAGWTGCRLQGDADRWTLKGALAGWSVLLVAGLFDVPSVFPFTTLYLALLMAILVYPLSHEGKVLNGWARLVPLMLPVCLGFILAWMDIAHGFQQRGVEAAKRGRWEESLSYLDRAVAVDPFLSAYRLQRGKVLGVLGLENGSVELAREALGIYLTTGGTEVSFCRAEAAWLAHAAGDTQEAICHMRRAIALTPAESSYHLGLGYLLEEAGEREKAIEAYHEAIVLSPSLTGSAFWRTSALREEVRSWWPVEVARSGDTKEGADRKEDLQESLALDLELGAPCPERNPPAYTSRHVYHREDIKVDFRPYVLRCAPWDDQVPQYLHLVDVYRRSGREEAAEALEAWLHEFYGDALEGNKLVR